jgi:hypothetical protein
MKRLAARWRVSQAEVVRRAVERAEAADAEEAAARIARLRAYHECGGLGVERAEAYMEEVAENRSEWGRGE